MRKHYNPNTYEPEPIGWLVPLFAAVAIVVAAMALMVGIAKADGAGSPAACETPYKDESAPFGWHAPAGYTITGVCIKAGQLHTGVLGNGTYNSCYVIAGVGTQDLTVTKIGSGPTCQDISHIDVVKVQDAATATPTPTATVPPSTPTPSATPSPSSTPTATATATATPTSTGTSVPPTSTATPTATTPPSTRTPDPTRTRVPPTATVPAPTSTPVLPVPPTFVPPVAPPAYVPITPPSNGSGGLR